VRVLLDVNVLVSSLLSRIGAPARLVGLWLEGEIELIVCPALLAELERTLARPKLRSRIDAGAAESFLSLLSEEAETVSDPEEPPPVRSSDPGDDYLLAVAAREQVPLVSGDEHVFALRGRAPILSPREFLDSLDGD
jgi:putative PIN family toxin of toxin-antitoxin system